LNRFKTVIEKKTKHLATLLFFTVKITALLKQQHNQSFLLKYLRIIRDNAKNLQNNKLISEQTSDQLKCKSLILKQSINSNSSNDRTITCQHCGTHVKNTTGLSAHQRLNTKCLNLVATLATLDRHEST